MAHHIFSSFRVLVHIAQYDIRYQYPGTVISLSATVQYDSATILFVQYDTVQYHISSYFYSFSIWHSDRGRKKKKKKKINKLVENSKSCPPLKMRST